LGATRERAQNAWLLITQPRASELGAEKVAVAVVTTPACARSARRVRSREEAQGLGLRSLTRGPTRQSPPRCAVDFQMGRAVKVADPLSLQSKWAILSCHGPAPISLFPLFFSILIPFPI
jgi:hypothetical protein